LRRYSSFVQAQSELLTASAQTATSSFVWTTISATMMFSCMISWQSSTQHCCRCPRLSSSPLARLIFIWGDDRRMAITASFALTPRL
jgi:hypothetical protein